MRNSAGHKPPPPSPRIRVTDITPLCIALFRRMTLSASVAKVSRRGWPRKPVRDGFKVTAPDARRVFQLIRRLFPACLRA